MRQVYIQMRHQKVHGQPPTYADNVALPAFARRRAHSSKPAAAGLLLWAHAGTDRQTDGHSTVS